MRILLVDDDKDILELYGVILESFEEKIEVLKVTKPSEAEDAFKDLDNHFDAIICDFDMSPNGSGVEVLETAKSMGVSCPFIFFSSNSEEEIKKETTLDFYYICKSTTTKEWVELLENILDLHQMKEKYTPIRIYHFLRFNYSRFDIYLKLSEEKFVKVITSNIPFDHILLEKYASKGIEHLYVETFYLNELFEDFHLSGLFHGKKEHKTPIEAARYNHKVLRSMAQSVGLNPYTLDIASDLSEKAIEDVKANSNLKNLIEQLIQSNNYSYDHTYLTTCFAIGISIELDFDTKIQQTLSFLSLVHDIGIVDEHLCRLHDLEPHKLKECSREEREIIKDHLEALDSIDIPSDPTNDMARYVQGHHFVNEDFPYGRQVSLERIPVTLCIFLVSHHLVVELYKADFSKKDLKNILLQIKKKFNTKNFNKITEVLDRIVIFNNSSN